MRPTRWSRSTARSRWPWSTAPAAGLALLDTVDAQLPGHHRVAAVRAHLLEMAGDLPAAIASFRAAATGTRSVAEQRYLTTHVAALSFALR